MFFFVPKYWTFLSDGQVWKPRTPVGAEAGICFKTRSPGKENLVLNVKFEFAQLQYNRQQRARCNIENCLQAITSPPCGWLFSCVVNRNRKVGVDSHDPVNTSTTQRHRNPNHHVCSTGLMSEQLTRIHLERWDRFVFFYIVNIVNVYRRLLDVDATAVQ